MSRGQYRKVWKASPIRTVDQGHSQSYELNQEDMEVNVWGGVSNGNLTLGWK